MLKNMNILRLTVSATKKVSCDIKNFARDMMAVTSTVSAGGGGILIVRIDAIGDYLLFRQCLHGLRHAPIFAGKKITLCGNVVWQPLAEALDGDAFDAFIPVDRNKFHTDRTYNCQVLNSLRQSNFDYALQPTFSRERMGDSLIWASRAAKRVGFACPAQNISKLQRVMYNCCYTQLIPPFAEFPFEVQRNEELLKFLSVSPAHIPPFQSVFPDKLLQSAITKSIRPFLGLPVLFIGANSAHRCWPSEYFAEIVMFLYAKLGKKIILGGGVSCERAMKEISCRCPGMTIPLPKTSLLDITALIAKAPLVVSNDSSGAHIGATFNTPTIIISNGQHRGRFTPYPKKIAALTSTVYPEAIQNIDYEYYYTQSPHSITSIHPNVVKKVILQYI